MSINPSSIRKRSIVDRFSNGNADKLIVDELTDDDLGNLFVYHSDTSHRDSQVWAKLTDPDNLDRINTCLVRMKNVNQLAVASRLEELESVRAEVESGIRDEADLRLKQAEFNSWNQRAKRFDIRVDMAFNEFKPMRKSSKKDSVERDFRELLSIVDRYLENEIDDSELENTFDSILERHPEYRGDAV